MNVANDWKYTFKGLTKSLNGKAYEYTVDEISVPAGYYNEVKTEDGKVKPCDSRQTVGTLNFEMPGENLGYVDGKDHGTVEALAAFDVEIRTL